MSLVVVVPTRGRPHALGPLARAFEDTTPAHRVLFVCDPDDHESHQPAKDAGDLLVTPRAGYPSKVNDGVRFSHEPLLLIAADDIEPHPGWFEAATALLSDEIGVVSPNDLGNKRVMRGEVATLPLVARWYAELGTIDEPGKLYHDGYFHNCCDWEFSETARYRNAFAYAPDAVIEHIHPAWGKAEVDQTYEEGGMNAGRFAQDKALLRERRKLWSR